MDIYVVFRQTGKCAACSDGKAVDGEKCGNCLGTGFNLELMPAGIVKPEDISGDPRAYYFGIAGSYRRN